MRFWLIILGLIFTISNSAENDNGSAPECAIQIAVNKSVTRSQAQESTPPSIEIATTSTPGTVLSVDPNMINYLCLSWILNTLSDKLYNIYCSAKTVRTFWIFLENNYVMADPTQKRYQASNLIKFKLIDNKFMSDHLHNFEHIVE